MSCSIYDTMNLLSLGDGGLNPSDAEIAAAPFIDNWSIETFALLGERVVGICVGHPLIPDGWINTSNPVHADLDRGWLKTRSRIYRLGTHREHFR
jgi:hypothetical protein